MGLAQEQLMAGKPRGKWSAKLSIERTYNEEIPKQWWLSSRVICCRTVFGSEILDFLPSIAWITPWLLDLISRWILEYPQWMTNKGSNLMATISAQPILHPFLFQPGQSFHESHLLSRTIPIPCDDEASTQKSMEVIGGFYKVELQKSKDN